MCGRRASGAVERVQRHSSFTFSSSQCPSTATCTPQRGPSCENSLEPEFRNASYPSKVSNAHVALSKSAWGQLQLYSLLQLTLLPTYSVIHGGHHGYRNLDFAKPSIYFRNRVITVRFLLRQSNRLGCYLDKM
ncbi:unnamed protein product [Heligmosomoides polygyrus]|uniref:Uncharacterized protein n=1 Tax=Heligmosomoides polygyrus TaxID=6339 RepID=A0A183GBP9_HELPZ|nr:unnamed protein product [Heligmosomoides polygyrus]